MTNSTIHLVGGLEIVWLEAIHLDDLLKHSWLINFDLGEEIGSEGMPKLPVIRIKEFEAWRPKQTMEWVAYEYKAQCRLTFNK